MQPSTVPGRGSLPALVALVGDPDRVITLADPSAGNLGVRFASGEPDDMPGILSKARRWWRPGRSPCRSPAPTLYATRQPHTATAGPATSAASSSSSPAEGQGRDERAAERFGYAAAAWRNRTCAQIEDVLGRDPRLGQPVDHQQLAQMPGVRPIVKGANGRVACQAASR
jgi:hypothetical protein